MFLFLCRSRNITFLISPFSRVELSRRSPSFPFLHLHSSAHSFIYCSSSLAPSLFIHLSSSSFLTHSPTPPHRYRHRCRHMHLRWPRPSAAPHRSFTGSLTSSNTTMRALNFLSLIHSSILFPYSFTAPHPKPHTDTLAYVGLVPALSRRRVFVTILYSIVNVPCHVLAWSATCFTVTLAIKHFQPALPSRSFPYPLIASSPR